VLLNIFLIAFLFIYFEISSTALAFATYSMKRLNAMFGLHNKGTNEAIMGPGETMPCERRKEVVLHNISNGLHYVGLQTICELL
jgi:hypothetical protein